MKKEEMNVIKILVSDMDGTLIKDYGEATEKMQGCWNSSKDEGIILAVSTGQSEKKMDRRLQKNGLCLPDYSMNDQGTLIRDKITGQMVKKMLVPNEPVMKIVQEFYKRGGRKEMVRVSTGDFVVVTKCPEAEQFFTEEERSDLLFTQNINYVIEHGEYCKVILMGTLEMIDKLVPYCLQFPTVIATNTGYTKYGSTELCKNYRLEIVSCSAGKRGSMECFLKYLGLEPGEIPEDKFVEVLAMGDEMSDYGLATCALSLNLVDNMRGYFAVVDNDTPGGKKLIDAAKELAESIGHADKVIIVSSAAENGGVEAINTWKKIIEK